MRSPSSVGFVALALVPAAAAALGQPFYLDLFAPHHDLRHRRREPQPDPRLRRHGQLRPRRLPRASAPTRSASSASTASQSGWLQWTLAIGASALVALAHRRRVDPHQRRVLHHDHAGLRADAVLPRHLARPSSAATTACGWRGGASSPARSIWPIRCVFYYLVARHPDCCCCVLGHRLVHSRFGMVIRAAASRTSRASRAIGFSTYPLPPGRLRAWPARCAAWPARSYANQTELPHARAS